MKNSQVLIDAQKKCDALINKVYGLKRELDESEIELEQAITDFELLADAEHKRLRSEGHRDYIDVL